VQAFVAMTISHVTPTLGGVPASDNKRRLTSRDASCLGMTVNRVTPTLGGVPVSGNTRRSISRDASLHFLRQRMPLSVQAFVGMTVNRVTPTIEGVSVSVNTWCRGLSNVSPTTGGGHCATKPYVPANGNILAKVWRQLTSQIQKLSPPVREMKYPLNETLKLSTLLRVLPNNLKNALKQVFRIEYTMNRQLSPVPLAGYTLALPDNQLLQQKLHEFYIMWKEKEGVI